MLHLQLRFKYPPDPILTGRLQSLKRLLEKGAEERHPAEKIATRQKQAL